jgi:hypothetical protein
MSAVARGRQHVIDDQFGGSGDATYQLQADTVRLGHGADDAPMSVDRDNASDAVTATCRPA